MSLQLDINKNYQQPNPNLPANQFLQYKQSSSRFNIKINQTKKNYINPLYSLESLTKYFYRQPGPKSKKLTDKFTTKQLQQKAKNPNIQKFKELQKLISKHQIQYQNVNEKMKQYQKFIQTQGNHYTNLNLDDGFIPESEQIHSNFLITCYLEKLKSPPKVKRMTYKKVIKENRRRTHTENIQDYINQQKISSRYRNPPKSTLVDQKFLVQSWQRKSKQLQSKTEYCRRKYKSPILRKQKLDNQIFNQSKLYISRKTKQTKSCIKF